MSGFGTSWARRRAAVAAEDAAEEIAAQEAQVQAEQAALAEKPDADILKELGLPDPDSMIMGDDFKAFMAKTVPAHIRKRALRTLWRSNPVLACVDGLNDYDDDYLTGSTGQGVIKTSYQVGKGMLAHLMEMERQKETAEATDDDVEVETPEVVDSPETASETTEVASEAAPEPLVEDTQADLQSLPPRRMRFQFEDQTA